ncbi:MAG: ZIP family metal transporter, partial [archaeon]|nr:ZIP family metal transporter [archaeon]
AIIFSFIVEKFIRWRHCHQPTSAHHPHPLATMNLLGDAVHNFLDGLIIGASYLISIPVGIATTLAVAFHEIPQEIGDFGVLLHAGFSRGRALLYNFGSALTSVLGVLTALFLGSYTGAIETFAAPFAAGLFIYIAGSDLIPELHKQDDSLKSIIDLVAFIAGVIVIGALVLFE